MNDRGRNLSNLFNGEAVSASFIGLYYYFTRPVVHGSALKL